jgi:hypothetical protein
MQQYYPLPRESCPAAAAAADAAAAAAAAADAADAAALTEAGKMREQQSEEKNMRTSSGA